jgi:hypothetical protein
MPHPNFKTVSEENSYWRHYDNYMESKQAEEDCRKNKNKSKSKSKKQPPIAPPLPKPNRQGLVAAEDGWFTVVTTKKH